MLRALVHRRCFFFTVTPLLISMQWLLDKLGLPGWGFIATNYYRVLLPAAAHPCPHGRRAGARPRVLFVSNHVSWVDIVVIGSIVPVAFVAKREVASWPLVGITAKLQRTVFVDRARRHQAGDAVAEIVQAARLRHLGGAVRGRHLERRQPRAAVPLGAGRRGARSASAQRRTAAS